MANILRSTLIFLRAEFLLGVVQSFFWLGGFTLLFWSNWQIGLGVLLVGWANQLRQAERKRA